MASNVNILFLFVADQHFLDVAVVLHVLPCGKKRSSPPGPDVKLVSAPSSAAMVDLMAQAELAARF